jgi:hypothetical protein
LQKVEGNLEIFDHLAPTDPQVELDMAVENSKAAAYLKQFYECAGLKAAPEYQRVLSAYNRVVEILDKLKPEEPQSASVEELSPEPAPAASCQVM